MRSKITQCVDIIATNNLYLHVALECKICVFGSVVAGVFQIIFRAKIHVNDVFLFFKNHF